MNHVASVSAHHIHALYSVCHPEYVSWSLHNIRKLCLCLPYELSTASIQYTIVVRVPVHVSGETRLTISTVVFFLVIFFFVICMLSCVVGHCTRYRAEFYHRIQKMAATSERQLLSLTLDRITKSLNCFRLCLKCLRFRRFFSLLLFHFLHEFGEFDRI